MKILYGVVGEGMGHAMRSRVVVDHLMAAGHVVEIMASSRAVSYLRQRFPEVHSIHGLHIVTDDNRVRKGKTLFSNVLSGAAAIPQQIGSYFKLVEDFEPDLVISDFESWSYFFAKAHRLPVLSVDNQQVINRCEMKLELFEDDRAAFEVVRAFVKGKLPFCDHYLVTSFFSAETRKENTTVVPPILRPEILSAETSKDDHLLVYQTAEGNSGLVDALRQSGRECRIYGMKRDLEDEEVDGKLRYHPFSETKFIRDLATAAGVIASAGFTLMSECVYLHKPMLAVPLKGQFEQVLNATYLEHEGYGRMARVVTNDVMQEFLDVIPSCEGALESYGQEGNQRLFDELTTRLDQAEGGLL